MQMKPASVLKKVHDNRDLYFSLPIPIRSCYVHRAAQFTVAEIPSDFFITVLCSFYMI